MYRFSGSYIMLCMSGVLTFRISHLARFIWRAECLNSTLCSSPQECRFSEFFVFLMYLMRRIYGFYIMLKLPGMPVFPITYPQLFLPYFYYVHPALKPMLSVSWSYRNKTHPPASSLISCIDNSVVLPCNLMCFNMRDLRAGSYVPHIKPGFKLQGRTTRFSMQGESGRWSRAASYRASTATAENPCGNSARSRDTPMLPSRIGACLPSRSGIGAQWFEANPRTAALDLCC